MKSTVYPRRVYSIKEAASESAILSQLGAIAQASNQRLQAIEALLPPHLRAAIAVGPYADGEWCLLVANSSVASKLRQMLPALLAHLRIQGLATESIRIKIQQAQCSR